jgi:uncharacterized protein
MTIHDASPTGIRARLIECIHHLEHVLPSQASIRDFVHHNTLHGFQHLPFPEALAAASRLSGGRVWLPEEVCRGFYRNGRIDDSDLDDAIERVGQRDGIDLGAVLATVRGRPVCRREVLRLGLVHPFTPPTSARFKWQVEELRALETCQADVSDASRVALLSGGDTATVLAELWKACLDVFAIDHAFEHPEALLELAAREEKRQTAVATAQEDFADSAAALWDELRQKVGADWTAAVLLQELSDEDAFETVRPLLIRHLAAHLDQGLAPWHNPGQRLGFYAAWRQSMTRDIALDLDNLMAARAEIAELPDEALEAIVAELTRIGLPEERWPSYLERLALELPGWSGMFLWRHNHPGYAETAHVPVAMLDYLAVRLVLERLVATDIVRRHWGIDYSLPALGDYFRRHPAELWVRHAFHVGDLPEYLLELIEPHLPAVGEAALPQDPHLWEWLVDRIEAWRATPTAERAVSHGLTRSAWPLFLLAQHLGADAAGLHAIGRRGAESLLGALRQLDEHQRGFIWLNAYERHYREQIFAGLAANHGRWHGHPSGPVAQLVFCMDDREEGMRRHLEETNPALETLGGAAHFAVFQNYYGLDDEKPTALCPVVPEVIIPSHDVHEVPRTNAGEKVGAGGTAIIHKMRHDWRLRWQNRLHQITRRGLVAGPLLTSLLAPLALLTLLWRTLSPAGFGHFATRLRERFELPVATRLDHNAPVDAGPATPQAPRHGFTDAEQAERIGNFLTALGLTKDFAPLVVIMGHGSNSTNNPHLAAYDCGACSGRHSGPNARLFAAMANRPEVRALLAARGIHVPAETHFVGGEHNTADDLITWYDTEDLPVALAPTLAQVNADLAVAGRAHAQERCRRLYSAPLGIGKAKALRHVWGRRNDYAQPRPELGHVTNACAFFGRRAMSRGAFFDRRAFLISYDPTQDADGKVLEKHLLINGAVGAGISLEYFFSTVNNELFGCGSKVMHNVAGYFGVMQGANSDLRTGLPKQMIEIHEAMRLLAVIEQKLDIITAVYQRQPPLQELVGNGWVIVAAKDPDTGAIHMFDPANGWQPWSGNVAVKTCKQSADWFAGNREPLPPVLLERPLECAA